MTRFIVEDAGPLTSVQDAGRFGAQRYGLAPSGAMDRYALAVANALVGRAPGDAAVEVGPMGARFTVREGSARIGFAGAPRTEVTIGERVVRPGESALIGEGETLVIKAAKGGMFSYVAIEGGFEGAPVFGSLAVNARAGLGSPYPRPLKPGDALALRTEPDLEKFDRRLPVEKASNAPVRVVLGPQEDYFTEEAIKLFFSSEWRVGAASDRMGFRLEGPKLEHSKGFNIVSDGTVDGHIQVPGNGQPLVLLMDRGTTGGYPKLGAVITADLGRFVQTPPGGTIRFKQVSIEEAQAAAVEMATRISNLHQRLEPMLGGRLSSEALLGVNLAGQAVSACDPATWQDVEPAFAEATYGELV